MRFGSGTDTSSLGAARSGNFGGRAARRALVVVALYATYLISGNLLLNSGTVRDFVNRKPEKLAAAWSRAWTLYPGHFHAVDLRLAGHLRHTAWTLQADSATGRVALLPLLAKEVRVPRVDATGVAGGASRIDEERLPPPARPGGWTLRFDRVVAADVPFAYVNGVVLEGQGRAEAGFVKVLRGGAMEVLPSHASFVQARISRNGALLAQDAAIDARFAIARHLRAEAPGVRKLEKTDLDASVTAATAGLSIESVPGGKPVLRATGDAGRLDGRIMWKRGELEPGGRLALSVPVREELGTTLPPSVATVAFEVLPAELRLTADLAPAAGASYHADADLSVRGRTIPVSEMRALAPRTSGHVLANWHFASLAWLAQLLPTSHPVSFDGAGSVRAQLKFSDGEVAPGSVLDVPQVTAVAHALGNRFEGDASATVRFDAAAEGNTEASLDALMREFRISPEDAPDKPFVLGRNLSIEAVTDEKPGELHEKLRARLRFANASVPDLRVYNHYLPATGLRLEGGSGTLSGDLSFRGDGDIGQGELSVSGESVRLDLAGLRLQGDIAVNTKLRRVDLDSRRFDADGSAVTVRRLQVLGPDGPSSSDWWGEITLDKARLDWNRPLAIDGDLRLRMKNVGLLLDVYAQRKELPVWVDKLVGAGEATAQGRIRWHGDTLLLQPFAATNERFDVQARMRMQREQLAGDLFARWGVLSLGVALADGRRDLHLVGARAWFDGQPVLPPP